MKTPVAIAALLCILCLASTSCEPIHGPLQTYSEYPEGKVWTFEELTDPVIDSLLSIDHAKVDAAIGLQLVNARREAAIPIRQSFSFPLHLYSVNSREDLLRVEKQGTAPYVMYIPREPNNFAQNTQLPAGLYKAIVFAEDLGSVGWFTSLSVFEVAPYTAYPIPIKFQ